LSSFRYTTEYLRQADHGLRMVEKAKKDVADIETVGMVESPFPANSFKSLYAKVKLYVCNPSSIMT